MSENQISVTENREPSQYPKRILLAVCGLSPQVVTETVYALAMAQAALLPTEIHLITTREGAKKAMQTLSDKGAGWLSKLARDYALPAISFDESHIHVLQTPLGVDLDDIRTVEDNQYSADFITDVVRQYTQDAEAALHVSIAGGRKTMGYYLGYALSLYGRHQDRLSHVLVQEPFENCPDFFYPTPYSQMLTLRDARQYDASGAKVALAQIPFVSLRHGLPQALLTGRASFNDTVRSIWSSISPPRLEIDLQRRRIQAGGVLVDMPPAELAFLSIFARRAKTGEPPLPAPSKGVPDHDWAKRYLDEYRQIVGKHSDIDNTERSLRHGMDDGYFSQRKSKLERLVRERLQAASTHYLIHNGNVRPGLFSLQLSSESISYCQLSSK